MATLQVFVFLICSVLVVLTQRPCDDRDVDVELSKGTCQLTPISVTAASGHLRIDDLNCNVPVDKTQFANKPVVIFPNAEEDAAYTLAVVDPDAPGLPKGTYFLHWLVTNIKGAYIKMHNFDVIVVAEKKLTCYGLPIQVTWVGGERHAAVKLLNEKLFCHLQPCKNFTAIISPQPIEVLHKSWGSDFASGNLKAATTLMDYMGPEPPKGSVIHHYMYYVFKQTNDQMIDGKGSEERYAFDLGAWLNNQQMCGPVAGMQFCASY